MQPIGNWRTIRTVFVVIDTSKMGGIETHVQLLAMALKRKDITVDVILLQEHDPHHPLLERLRVNSVDYRCLAGVGALYELLQSEPPDIVHTHGYKAGILGRLFCRWLRIPVVSTFHAGEPGIGRLRVYTLLDRYTAQLANRVIAVSASVAAAIRGPCEVIENFVEVVDAPNTKANTVAFVGRLSYEKGPDLFLDIARLLPNITFAVYGDGPMRHQLTHSAPDNVAFHGQVHDMAEHWQNIGLLCMSSRHEGLPMAALEAMARGIPVCAFCVGGLPQLIDNDKNGWTPAPGNVQQMVDAIERWHALSPDERNRFSDAARTTIASRYSAEKGIERVLAIYQQAIADRR